MRGRPACGDQRHHIEDLAHVGTVADQQVGRISRLPPLDRHLPLPGQQVEQGVDRGLQSGVAADRNRQPVAGTATHQMG
jgi:hypothetical protein